MQLALITSALLGIAAATTENARVYITNKDVAADVDGAGIVSSPEARLIIAQRLDVARYHDIHEASDKTLEYISRYGGDQHTLFEATDKIHGKQLVVIAEGYNYESKAWSDLGLKQVFEIQDPASSRHNAQFVQDLQNQLAHGPTPKECYVEDLSAACWQGSTKVVHIDALMDARIERFINSLTKYVQDSQNSLLLIAMPESSRASKHHLYPYGPYEMPTSNRERRGLEDPLVAFENPKATSKETTGSKYSPSASSNNTSPLKLPALCYPSKDTCDSKTNSCSGHGSCYKRYSSSESDCFACRCEPTFHKGKDGRSKTIYYGGNACQKRDVSSQFWLIASFTIVLVGLISWAIGMMFGIGEEKLPGVIGAGVSGPKAGRTGM